MSLDIEKLRMEFDREAFCEVYLRKAGIEKQQVDHFLYETLQIQQMKISGLTWFPTSHLISAYPIIPLLTHYGALAAAYNQPFEGIEDFYCRMIDRALLPAWYLNQTRFHKVPAAKLLTGELMCELGLISEHTLQRCLGTQRLIQDKGKGLKPALATIISALDCISIPDLFQSLAIQCGVPFRSLDESAPAIFEMTGKRDREPD